MAATAFQTLYRSEFIAGFEQRQSLLRDSCTTEAQVTGNTAVFLVADSGSSSAVTRGVNGLIPARADNNTQNSCTLAEWHDLVRKTGFNIFASQGNQRAIMQQTTMGVINRKIDSDIITELNTGTVNTGAAVTGSVGLVMKAKTILGNASVPWDGNIYGTITPAFEAYLMQTKEFASAEYVNNKPMPGADPAWRDKPSMFYWLNVTWCVHPNLPGKGTNAEKCFLHHKSAIGHAVNSAGIQSPVGYDEEQDYSWARATVFMGSKVLQNAGIVVINHDGSALVAA
jgi:hypothetical protein